MARFMNHCCEPNAYAQIIETKTFIEDNHYIPHPALLNSQSAVTATAFADQFQLESPGELDNRSSGRTSFSSSASISSSLLSNSSNFKVIIYFLFKTCII